MLNLRKLVSGITLVALSTSGIHQTWAQNKGPIKVIDPDKKIASANPAALDTEHFELGVYTGLLAVEDFNTNPVLGISLRYYFNEKYLIDGSFGTSETERANTEGNQDFNPERDFQYFSLSGGYQLLKGRSFRGKKRKYNTGIYLLGGIEQVDFADNSNTGLVIGVSYKTILTDWLTVNLDFKNHIVNRDFIEDDKMTQNTEFAIGFSTLF